MDCVKSCIIIYLYRSKRRYKMSRLGRYVDSLQKFIKDRSCLFDKEFVPDDNVKDLLLSKIKKSDLILSILMLTVMNSQNKKNGITLQGYYMAVTVEFLSVMINIFDDIKEKDQTNSRTVNYLMMCSYKSLCHNLETVKNTLSGDDSTRIFLDSMSVYNDNVNYNKLLNKHQFTFVSDKDGADKMLDVAYRQVYKWYIKDDNSLNDKFKKIRQIEKSSYLEYVDKKVGSLCEIALCAGWIIGSGNIKKLKKLKKTAKNFAYFYKVSQDFLSIEQDIRSSKDSLSTNYILNYGLQDAYNFMTDSKTKFIEDALTFDIYTITIKEIISSLESKVDEVIDETSPDLKSNYSKVTL